MRSNVQITPDPVYTHEGGPGKSFSPKKELERAVAACLLGEENFYESGSATAKRIADLVTKNDPRDVATLAVRARTEYKLRHVPLFLVRELSRHKGHAGWVEYAIQGVIQRADEPGELISMYPHPRKPKRFLVPAAVKRGLALAIQRFDEYAIAKWGTRTNDRVKFRHILRMLHAAPKDQAQSELWKRAIADELPAPDTWEVALSAGADKRATFERLLQDKKLGGLALLRNLRNCIQSGVEPDLVRSALATHPFRDVLPFRFIAAAKEAPGFEPELDTAMIRAAKSLPVLKGRTALLIDVSGSMDAKLSGKSDLTRMDAAGGLAILAAAVSEQFMVATFSELYVVVPPRDGMALRDAIVNSQPHSGTWLGRALTVAYSAEGQFNSADRVIVITDEQSSDAIPHLLTHAPQRRYLLNVGIDQTGVATSGSWERITGFSEAVLRYIEAVEDLESDQR